jgi:hypothetical protein
MQLALSKVNENYFEDNDMSKLHTLIGAVALALCAQAQAALVTFNNTAGTYYGTVFGNPTATFSNYKFKSDGAFTFGLGNSAALDYLPTAYNGTDYFVTMADLTITSNYTSPFSLTSIDLVGWNSLLDGATLTGVRADGSTVTQNVYFRDTPNLAYAQGDDFKKVTLTNFTNLKSVTIGGIGFGMLAIDNLNIGVAAVPEPGTLAILGLGLGAMALGRRRRKAV